MPVAPFYKRILEARAASAGRCGHPDPRGRTARRILRADHQRHVPARANLAKAAGREARLHPQSQPQQGNGEPRESGKLAVSRFWAVQVRCVTA
jgi:hypothetical protein